MIGLDPEEIILLFSLTLSELGSFCAHTVGVTKRSLGVCVCLMKYFQHLSSTSIMLKDVLQLLLFNLSLTSAIFVLPIAKYLVLPSLTLPPSSLGRKRTKSYFQYIHSNSSTETTVYLVLSASSVHIAAH